MFIECFKIEFRVDQRVDDWMDGKETRENDSN